MLWQYELDWMSYDCLLNAKAQYCPDGKVHIARFIHSYKLDLLVTQPDSNQLE